MIDYSKSLQILKSRLRPVVVVGTGQLVYNANCPGLSPPHTVTSYESVYEHLGWGTGRPTSVDRDGLPRPYSDLGPDYSSYIFCRASGPISTSHQLILVIDIV